MNKEKIYCSKNLFSFSFITAIVGYGVSFILYILSLVFSINEFSRQDNPSDYWEVHTSIAISIVFALSVFISSLLVFIRTKEKDKGGFVLMNFASYFLLTAGVCSLFSGAAYVVSFIFSYGVWVFEQRIGISILVFSVLLIAIAVGSLVLYKKSPKIRRIVLLVECVLFAVLNFLNMAFYIHISNYIYMAASLISFVFDVIVVFVLIVMKIKNEEATKIAPLAETKVNEEEKVTLLLKYKDLLDKGVISQAEFDEKKKELL